MPVSVPTFIKQAWAAVGTKFTIPDNANPTTGRAGWDQGFSPINLTPVAAGGIPPFGQDMNGVLYDITSAIQYIQSGLLHPFDSDFALSIGGYARGSIVSDSSDGRVVWVNNTPNNLEFPSGWTSASISQATETLQGTAKIATQAQVNAGSDDLSYVTSKKLRAGFLFSFGTSGYVFFPTWMGGWGLQWLRVGSAAPGGSVVTPWATEFPVECVAALCTPIGAGVNTNAFGVGTAFTKAGCTVYNWGSATTMGSGVVLSIGR